MFYCQCLPTASPSHLHTPNPPASCTCHQVHHFHSIMQQLLYNSTCVLTQLYTPRSRPHCCTLLPAPLLAPCYLLLPHDWLRLFMTAEAM
jgi:hypothetical protein